METTRVYPRLEVGQVVSLSKRPSARTVLRALVPLLVMAEDMFDDVVFHVVNVGPRRTVHRHADGCANLMSSESESCTSCDGMLVEFDTDIWISADVDVRTSHRSKFGEVTMVIEKRTYKSWHAHRESFVSYLSSELLDLEYEEEIQ